MKSHLFGGKPREGFVGLLLKTFFNRNQWRLWLLLAIVICAYLVNVKLAVALNDWNGRFYNALQTVDKEAIFSCLYDFIVLCSAIIVVLVTADYLQRRAALIARRQLTYEFFEKWLGPSAPFYRLRINHNEPDNPDQRIAEDIRDLIHLFLDLATSFFNSVLYIGSFSVILWNLSGSLTIFGQTIPGYMFWVCLGYTILETLFTHLIGRKLKDLNFEAQRREADLRSSLLFKREHSEAIAGLKGQMAEKKELIGKFTVLLSVLIDILKRRRNLEYFSVGVGQVTHLTPIFFSLPAFFAGVIELGGLMQIRGAFVDIARSLSWIAMSYQELARFVATYERLSLLNSSVDETNEKVKEMNSSYRQGKGINLKGTIRIENRGSLPRILRSDIQVKRGELALLVGPSGSGKSTLLRTIAGFNDQFTGNIEKPESLLWVPQKPYIFPGTLKANLAYPYNADELSDDKAITLLEELDLGFLSKLLNLEINLTHRLSGGEQQRLMLARVLWARPQALLLDEITSSLDESTAEKMVSLIRKKISDAAVILVTHQKNLQKFADKIYFIEDFYERNYP